MKIHLNSHIYDTFYIMKNINYQLNNPLDTKNAPKQELNIKKPWKNPKISRNSLAKFRLI
ncbi:MAG: hypothetical protein IJ258_10055 [Methanobrevibacter sp.]|uniref:hypothetical protein n=1 Tax=Methanobrevibacter sp. TaxID=66852 RepID=UPI0025F22E30|nr:hypothetical protein [Methanobrevibacter sp.]MBQ8018429.1 hypothetical protein [Methanobrevibacter sp.]